MRTIAEIGCLLLAQGTGPSTCYVLGRNVVWIYIYKAPQSFGKAKPFGITEAELPVPAISVGSAEHICTVYQY